MEKDKSLKASWPQILVQEPEYAKLVYSIMRCKVIQQDIWRCRLLPQDVDLLKLGNQFWKDVLKSWNSFNYYQQNRIENQGIWYNSMIRVGNKPIMWNDAYIRGLWYVHQLFQDRKFKSSEKIYEEFGMSVMRYNSLKAAIPEEWRHFFLENLPQVYRPIPPDTYDMAINVYGKKLTQKVYQFNRDDVLLIHNKYLKWMIDLGPEFCEGIVDFGMKHKSIYRITNVPKYRSFQYRLLQRGLITNIHMYKWGMIMTDQCTFCHRYEESYVHLFFLCEHVQELWSQVAEYIRVEFGITSLLLTPQAVVMNEIHKSDLVANFLCLVTKQYIYRQRCMKKEIIFYELKALFKKIRNIEKYIAIKNGKIQIFNKKWKRKDRDSSLTEFIQEYVNVNM